MRDVENLYAGISYMQYLEGEKHLVFLTPQGLELGSLDRATTIGRLASDARVALDVVHTYGMIGAPPPSSRHSFALPSAGMIFNQRFKIENSRHLSALTGGETAAFKYGSATFARLDGTTRAQYLLGYAPTNAARDGTFRRVNVTVNRPGVKVIYRQGYYAREQQGPIDRRAFMTLTRITAAIEYHLPIRDINVTLDEPVLIGSPGNYVVTARGHIGSGVIQFARKGDLHVASLEGVFTCGDEKARLVGDVRQTLDFELTEANYQRFLREGLSFTVRVPVSAEPAALKVIVYDYPADAIGSEIVRLKRS